MKRHITRKEFLKDIGRICLALLGGGLVTASCSKSDQNNRAVQNTATDLCTDISYLSAQDAQTRTTFKYQGQSDDPTRSCDKCALWQGISGAGPCGTCQVIKGPINANGTCTAFVSKPA